MLGPHTSPSPHAFGSSQLTVTHVFCAVSNSCPFPHCCGGRVVVLVLVSTAVAAVVLVDCVVVGGVIPVGLAVEHGVAWFGTFSARLLKLSTDAIIICSVTGALSRPVTRSSPIFEDPKVTYSSEPSK